MLIYGVDDMPETIELYQKMVKSMEVLLHRFTIMVMKQQIGCMIIL